MYLRRRRSVGRSLARSVGRLEFRRGLGRPSLLLALSRSAAARNRELYNYGLFDLEEKKEEADD